MGNAYADLGESRAAIEHLEQALTIAREIGDAEAEATTLGNLGVTYADLGEPRRALEHFEQVLTTMRKTGVSRDEGKTHYNCALALDQLGERGEAIRGIQEVLRIDDQIESPWRENARAKLAEWRREGSG